MSSRVIKAARDESYLEERMGGRTSETSETLHSCRCGCNWEKVKCMCCSYLKDTAFTQDKHDKYSLKTKTQKPANKII